MQPAFSVIFLTTLAVAAQGLFLALYGTEISGLGALTASESRQFLSAASAVALVLTGLGLLASFFHLGHPERAWRTATMWRTSWLAREVIALPLFMLGLFVYAGAHWFGVGNTRLIGAVTVLLCLALFVATAMIYASVRFLQEWASPLTLVNYLLLGCASGLTLATLLAWVTRSASLVRNARLKPKSTLQSAIGIKHPRIVQKAQGFTGGSFNTREFFHGRSVPLLRSVKWAFLLLVLAFVLQYLGLLAERWFFFAQANHPQNLYYQTIS
ncbi:MAG: DMSO reductase [Comamonadaceae bacterium CG_4_9_14_3_um_filter_60_33]|nr:MAG: DMSO reductase [Comamonadaceae bacterium CG2_30_59_20]PJB46094.1 MAG: DMSO reductase [Comamonadaceae bacterium CG_4_9_14_3_um_filter_60_33]